ncbi:PH domain-containing protein [Paenibacillus sp. NPDC058071]|uniref:PH domain-containing protein n=1 Tax=Paenibacillus sp. NPDC058071 TaxID=3346326 RepID=UPI0036DEC2AE
MFNRNPYFDQYFKQIAEPDESYHYYFYVMKFASLTKHLIFQSAAPLFNSHMIVCVTNKRVIICQMDGTTGRLTGATFEASMNEVKNISLDKGLIKTKVRITFSDDSVAQFKPNNICIGLSNHKIHLLKLKEIYG